MTPSLGQILVRIAEPSAALAVLDRELGRFRFRRVGPDATLGPKAVVGMRGAEVREFLLGRAGEWALFVAEDLESLFESAYAIHCGTGAPVIASIRFGADDWRLKAYGERDLLMKVGQDPDRELQWVGRPLDAERAPAVARLLGSGFTGFVDEVLRGRASMAALDRAVGQRIADRGFKALVGPPHAEGLSYVAWAQEPWG